MFYRPKIFYPKRSYSMLGEDLIVEKFFKNKKIKKSIFVPNRLINIIL